MLFGRQCANQPLVASNTPFLYEIFVAFKAKVALGKWDANERAWPFDLAGYAAAEVSALHVDNQRADTWERGNAEIRWTAPAPPPADGAGAWVEVSVPGRLNTTVVVAALGLLGTVIGVASTTWVAMRTNTCTGDLKAAQATIDTAKKQSDEQFHSIATCQQSLGDVTGLCQ